MKGKKRELKNGCEKGGRGKEDRKGNRVMVPE
jgi:hypothetical protein